MIVPHACFTGPDTVKGPGVNLRMFIEKKTSQQGGFSPKLLLISIGLWGAPIINGRKSPGFLNGVVSYNPTKIRGWSSN